MPVLIFAVLGLAQYKFRMDHSTRPAMWQPVLLLTLTQYKSRMDHSTETYPAVADEMISAWRSRPFTSLTNIAPIRSVLVYNGGVKLDEAQTDSLLTTVGAWFRAYSEGSE